MKRNIIIIATLVIAAGWATLTLAAEAKATFDKEVSAVGIRHFTLSNTNGDVEILSTNNDNITVHAIKKITGPSEEECEALLDKLQITVNHSPAEIEVKHSKFNRLRFEESIEYTILIPSDIQIEVETNNGNISCKDRESEVRFKTEDGDIELANCTGNLIVRTTNGNITTDCITNEANFETTNGNLDLYIDLVNNGRMKIATANGTIRLRLPGDVSTMLSAETESGSISGGAFTPVLSINSRHTYASGKFGGGEGSIIIQSKNGAIAIDAIPKPEHTALNNSSQTVVATTPAPVVVQPRTVVVETPCYPVFRHFWRPLWYPNYIYVPPVRIVSWSHDRHWDHHDWGHNRGHQRGGHR